MDLTIDELAALLGGRVLSGHGRERDGSWRVTGAASISDAGERDVTFFGNPRYLPALKACKAGCVLVPEGFDEPVSAVPIAVANPTVAFSLVLERFTSPPVPFAPGVHPTAVIGEGVCLGAGVSIQPHAVIEPGASIGDGTIIGAGVYVGHGTRIGVGCHIYPNVTSRERCVLGNRVIIHPGAVIGGDGFGFELVAGRHAKIPQTGIVQIDDDVEIGSNATVDRARFGRTWIGEGTKIDNLVQIAHNVVVGKHVLMASQVGISGSTRVGNYATLAGQVGVVGHIEIGDQAVVGAQGGVSKSVAPKQFVWGTPACPMDEYKVRLAYVARLPRLANRVVELERLVEELRGKAQSEQTPDGSPS